MVVVCQVLLGFSRRGCRWLFQMTDYIVQTTGHSLVANLPTWLQDTLRTFPRDVRTATEKFQLDAKATVKAACPKCHHTHDPTYINNLPIYPELCQGRHRNSRCGELLVRPKSVGDTIVSVPIRPYVAFDFKHWLGGVLSRPESEKLMDGAWQRMGKPEDGNLHDIFQGSVISNLKAKDEKTPFHFYGDKDAGHYVFSFCHDDFSSHSKGSVKRASIGLLALACLNFPIEMRFKPENMFLAGIIPGPKTPPLDAINPYLTHIVDAFLEFWAGVFFTQTALFEMGRLIFCALVAIVCDSPAARKVAGFSSFKHEYFCWRCWCNKTEHHYDHYDISVWTLRTNEESRRHANAFLAAPNDKEAKKCFDQSGLRWSEFLRLPYFDPTRFVVVDPMHNLFLGLIREHFQKILGGQVTVAQRELSIIIRSDQSNPLPTKKGAKASVRRLVRLLERPLNFKRDKPLDDKAEKKDEEFQATVKHWAKDQKDALIYVARGLGCLPPTKSPQNLAEIENSDATEHLAETENSDETENLAETENSAETLPKKLTRKYIAAALLRWVMSFSPMLHFEA